MRLRASETLSISKLLDGNARTLCFTWRTIVINRRTYHKDLDKIQRSVNKRVRGYLKDQSADNVHDLRTAVRRLLACIKLLPGTTRRAKKTAKYVARYEKLLRLNAKVRDLDIIISRVAARSSDSGYAEFAKSLEDSRKAAAKPAIQSASSIGSARSLSIDEDEIPNLSLRGRFDKITKRLEAKIEKRLPLVLKDSSMKEELHRLREDARMLRYTIDLGGISKDSQAMIVLRSWQDLLGLIHDSDIVIQYLQNQKESPEIRDLLRDEFAERNKNYEKFATSTTAKGAFKLSHQKPIRGSEGSVQS